MAQIYISNEELEGYLHTLEIAKKSLPSEAAQIHYTRLRELIEKIERLIQENK